MSQPSVQLHFPCPSCGHLLKLEGFTASGPCPTCQVPITVNLSVTVGAPPADSAGPIERLAPAEGENSPQLKYDERRFRPVLRMPGGAAEE